jgi:hypothetical protein
MMGFIPFHLVVVAKHDLLFLSFFLTISCTNAYLILELPAISNLRSGNATFVWKFLWLHASSFHSFKEAKNMNIGAVTFS